MINPIYYPHPQPLPPGQSGGAPAQPPGLHSDESIGEALLRIARQHVRIHAELDQRQPRISGRPADYDGFQPDHEPFDYVGAIDLPAVAAGETVVLAVRVPQGYDGIVTGIGHVFNGGAFVSGSNDIVWRLRRDQAYFRNYANMLAEFGDSEPRDLDGGLVVHANELIEYTVQQTGGGGGGPFNGRVVCQIRGRFWPQR